MNRQEVVTHIIGDRNISPRDKGVAFAPSNIALCKYWGKRDEELNLPVTSSLSISLKNYVAQTELQLSDEDRVVLNGKRVSPDDSFTQRAIRFLDLFRLDEQMRFTLTTQSNIPIAAGVASSAAGFAALVLALNDLFQWDLASKELSILARLGSGSACRSIYSGFVQWHAGCAKDGMDSYAEPLESVWSGLQVGLLTLSDRPKSLGSRAAMKRTVQTSVFYDIWTAKVKDDCAQLQNAIHQKDFERFGTLSESNALAMHATMLTACPPVLYWIPQTLETIHRIWALREQGVDVYFTMDAGPNIKLLYLKETEQTIVSSFQGVQRIAPFTPTDNTVNIEDVENLP